MSLPRTPQASSAAVSMPPSDPDAPHDVWQAGGVGIILTRLRLQTEYAAQTGRMLGIKLAQRRARTR